MVHEADETAERLTNLAHLASAIGHHVINAYAAIVSNAEILRITCAEAGTPESSQPADIIIRTAIEASAVARRLIDFTRPVTNVGDGYVALDEIVIKIADQHQRERRSRVNCLANPSPVPRIRGHADQVEAMIGHLIQNAEEAMSTKGGTITLSTSVDDRGWIVLDVVDTGPGMPPEIHERAVEPFFSTKNGRMGVGLSIANGIWRRHRGTLALKTGIGNGTCIRLCVNPVEGGVIRSR